MHVCDPIMFSEGGDGVLNVIDVSTTGILTSPQYPDPYPAGIYCMWTLRADPGHKVSLTVTSFTLQDCNDCSCDVFTVKQPAVSLLSLAINI